MKFSEYCDMVEGTEQEQQFLEFMKQDHMAELKKVSAKMKSIPFLGKLMTAIVVLSESESIAEFKESKYYSTLANFEFTFDHESGSFGFSPSDQQKKKIAKVVCIALTIIALLVICCKFCCCKKKAK
ncbi:MAG: hypothetical protein FWC32_00300 [Firmicutes bacterium]|nr:hypothetical protein [Bacillota bacterium]